MEKSDFNHILYVRDIFCQVFPFYRTAITHKNIFVIFFHSRLVLLLLLLLSQAHAHRQSSVSFPRNYIFTSSICVFLCCSWHIYIFFHSPLLLQRDPIHIQSVYLQNRILCLNSILHTRIHFRRFVSTLTILVGLTVCYFLLIGISHIFIRASFLDFVYIFAFS